MIPFYSPGDLIIKNHFYIYNNNLYKALQSIQGDTHEVTPEGGKNYYAGERVFFLVSPFVFGLHYNNLTTNYISDSSEYNPQTHSYLGDYLRSIRGFCGLNLMPFYNCFNNVYLTNVDLVRQKQNKSISCVIQDVEDGYKILSVPIRYYHKYSIYIDSLDGFDYCPVLYGKNTLAKSSTEDLSQTLISSLPDYYGNYRRCRYSDFKTPFVINEVTPISGLEKLAQYESCLRLLIKLPKNNRSSVVVLEGDYSEIPSQLMSSPFDYSNPYIVVGNGESKASEYTWAQASELKLGPLKLNWVNDGQIYAFTDTLPQYLLLSVISNADPIDKNIERTQEYVSSVEQQRIYGNRFKSNYLPGIWSTELREYLFNLMMTNPRVKPNTRLDIAGYVDKLTEQAITRGQKT